ncbi:Bacterial extracellular solute-binding protein [Paenibacillus konkukensis]|uniref:Bacterial extracellular solute-binding protein n=1 Tax=Paenibacillus konkukensis TaxID=2020716 RepID=A0ABY4RFL6_9BACL|nr:extracellular solute-binding protein [Paenibacillus konkukensis]UQZ81122.1 Bacterial extracellular solute-binding protein [Paenibacillus konkukensis]
MRKRLELVFICLLLTAGTACQAGGGRETVGREKPKSKDGKTIVALSVKEQTAYYEAAAKKFNEKHPDIELQIHSFKPPGEKWGGGDMEKYAKATNTAVLSGSGADLLEMTDLPVGAYANKKLLLNLNDMLEQDPSLNKSDLQTNILDALKMNGGLYTIPGGFMLRAFVGDGNVLNKPDVKIDDAGWSWNEFEDTARKLVQKTGSGKDRRYALADDPPEVILQEWVADSYGEFIDRASRKASFDSPAFTALLRQIKQLYDEKMMTSEPIDNGKQLFYSARFMSPEDIINEPYRVFTNPRLLQKPHPEGSSGGIRIIPFSELAIQANSPVKEEAWEVIAFLLSEEAQSLPDREGFALLKSVNEKRLGEMQKQVRNGSYKLSTGQTVKVPDDYFARFKQFLNTADRYSEMDVKVLSIIYEESEAFFAGQKSAEAVAKLIQNRTTTYLNE